MTIQTDITPDDWAAFVRFVTQSVSKGLSARVEAWLIAIGVGAVIGVTCSVTGLHLHFPSVMAGFLGAVAWLIVLSRLRMRRIVPAPDGVILGPREVSLDDDGLRETSPRHESVYRWQAVRGAEVTDKHIFVMVDTNGSVIVPRRVFSSEDECQQFVSEVQRRAGKVIE